MLLGDEKQFVLIIGPKNEAYQHYQHYQERVSNNNHFRPQIVSTQITFRPSAHSLHMSAIRGIRKTNEQYL